MKKTLFSLSVTLLLLSCGEADRTPDGPITLNRGNLSVTVEPERGARIASFTLNGREILKTSRDSAGLQWGSTAWTSPQSDWGWPPIATFDREAYTVERLDSTSVLLVSAVDETTGLQMMKRLRLGPDSDLGITYWLTNKSDTTVSVAAWENTRLPYAGRFEFGADSVRLSEEFADPTEGPDSARVVVLDERHPTKGKLFSDIRSPYVSYFNNGLELRKFTDTQDLYRVAPGQAPLEIYLEPGAGFAEFELQGDFYRLDHGQTSTLRTRWQLLEDL